MLRVHLDTDIGGDTDDLCALALLLASAEVDLIGVTTVADTDGRRLAFVRHALALAGRADVPVASGAFGFLGVPQPAEPQDGRYWPALRPQPATRPGEALDLLYANAQSGAAIIAIGPYTNLAILESMRPGAFANANVVVMGGHIGMPEPGLPQWGPGMDYNVQADQVAAQIAFTRLDPLIVPVATTLKVCLRAADLRALRAGGRLAQLMALQGELHRADWEMDKLSAANVAVPDDILNFQYDSLAVAAAMGWDCVTIEELPLTVGQQDGCVVLGHDPAGRLRRVVTDVDASRFSARWLAAVSRL